MVSVELGEVVDLPLVSGNRPSLSVRVTLYIPRYEFGTKWCLSLEPHHRKGGIPWSSKMRRVATSVTFDNSPGERPEALSYQSMLASGRSPVQRSSLSSSF